MCVSPCAHGNVLDGACRSRIGTTAWCYDAGWLAGWLVILAIPDRPGEVRRKETLTASQPRL